MRALDLFPDTRPARKPRKLMHVIDAGDSGCCAEDRSSIAIVKFGCRRCGQKTDWLRMSTVTEAKKGIPCPKCNSLDIEPREIGPDSTAKGGE